jgi:DNA-binding NarL/FixJ family response regulator
MPKKIIIADDHPLVREGLKYILSTNPDYVVAAEVGDGHQLLLAVSEEIYDIALVDMLMPGKNGIELIQQLRQHRPELRILVISSHKEDIYAVRTIRAGASGYLCKDHAASELVNAVNRLASGRMYITEEVAEQLALASMHTAPLKQHNLLSDREYQVFLKIASGRTMTAIAEELNLSLKTVSTYKTRINEKMSFHSSFDIVRYALENNLLVNYGTEAN